MNVKVYHNPNFNSGDGYGFRVNTTAEKDFEGSKLVLEANTQCIREVDELLEDVYKGTNSIDESWENNWPEHCVKGEGNRSTSVNDFVSVDNVVFVVDGCGFKKLDDIGIV
jgi:hypothetical protein